MKTLRFLSGGLTSLMLVAILTAAGAWLLRSSITRRARVETQAQEKAIATVTATKGNFDVAVVCTGTLAAVNSKPAMAEVSGQVIRVIPSGTLVKEGDVIVELDLPRMERRVRDQQRQYQQAVEDLEEKRRDLNVNVEKAHLQVEQNKRELSQYQAQQDAELANKRDQKKKDEDDLALSQQRYERQKKLAAEGLIPGREVELADTQLKAKQFNIERETKQLELAEASAASGLMDKQAALREAEANLESAISKRRDEIGDSGAPSPTGMEAPPAGAQASASSEARGSLRSRRAAGEEPQAGGTAVSTGRRREGRQQPGASAGGTDSTARRGSGAGGSRQGATSREGARSAGGGTTPGGNGRGGGRTAQASGGAGSGGSSTTRPGGGVRGGARGGGPGLPPTGAWGGQVAGVGTAVLQLQMNKAQLDRVAGDLAKSKVTAPSAGIVILEQEGGRGMQSRDLQPGDRVWEGRPIATIADLSEMRIDTQLDPEQARRVKRKQKVVITVDALPGKTFEGEVTELSQTAAETTLPGTGMPSGERTFPAKISVKNLKGVVLLPGMTAQVRIITKTIKNAISVPVECVFQENEASIVYVRKGEAFRPVEVETGEQSDGMIVIKSGLKGGEILSLRAVKRVNTTTSTSPAAAPPAASPVTGGGK